MVFSSSNPKNKLSFAALFVFGFLGYSQVSLAMNEDPNNQEPSVTLAIRPSSAHLIEPLPEDLSKKVFSYLGDFYDLVTCSRTCIYWHNVLCDTLQNKVFIIGPTGSGKSSFVHLIQGKSLIAKEDDNMGVCLLNAPEEIPNINIAHACSTGTLHPTAVCDFLNKRIIIDCPGFGDPRGLEQEYTNAMALFKLLKGKVSVVFIMSEGRFSTEKGHAFSWLMNTVNEIFPEQEELQNMLSFIISHKESKSASIKRLNEFREPDTPFLTKKGHELIQFLVDNPKRFAEFKYPAEEGIYLLSDELKTLMQELPYVTNPQISMPLKESITSDDRQGRWSSQQSYSYSQNEM